MSDPLTDFDEIDFSMLNASPAPAEPEAAPVKPFRAGTPCSWLVQMRNGRALRVDAWRCETSNGVLSFCDDFGTLIAAFEYGDWKRVAIMDRETGENDGWTVIKESRKR